MDDRGHSRTGKLSLMRSVPGIRGAAVIAVRFGGIVLLAVSLGATAGRFAVSNRIFLVSALVTGATAFAGGTAISRRSGRL